MWKKKQTDQKSDKRTKLAFIALGSLLLIVVLGQLLSLFTSLSGPFNLPREKVISDPNFSKPYSWDKNSSINLVLATINGQQTSEISVISLHPKDEKAIVLKIAGNSYIELPKGFGSWSASSVYKLGQEESPPIGPKLLKLSIAKLLGLPIDGIIILENTPEDASKIISNLRSNPASIISYLQKTKSDLTFFETLQIYRSLSGIRSDKVNNLDIEKSNITESKLLPDSSRVLGVDTIRLDLFIRDKMSDQVIADEGKTVAIFNATTHPGLALVASRMITNLGGNVIQVANTEETVQKSAVFLVGDQNGGAKNLTTKRLIQIFAPFCLENNCTTSDSKIINSRAQINIVLGEDYYNLWNEREGKN